MKTHFQNCAFVLLLIFSASACTKGSVSPSNLLDALPRILSTGAKIAPEPPAIDHANSVSYPIPQDQQARLLNKLNVPSLGFPN